MGNSSDNNDELDQYGVWVKTPPENQDSDIKNNSEEDTLPDFNFLDTTTENENLSELTDIPLDLPSTLEDIETIDEAQLSLETEEVSLDDFLNSPSTLQQTGDKDTSSVTENVSVDDFIPDGDVPLDSFLDLDSFDDNTQQNQTDLEEEPLDINLTFDEVDSIEEVQQSNELPESKTESEPIGEEISLEDINEPSETDTKAETGTVVDLDNFDDIFDNLNDGSSTDSTLRDTATESESHETEEVDLSEFDFDTSIEEPTPVEKTTSEPESTDFTMTVKSDDSHGNAAVIPEEIEKEVSDLAENAHISENMFIQLAQDLQSLRDEIASLRKEVKEIRENPPANRITTDDQPTAKDENQGFFADSDGDDTIALSSDQLGDILNDSLDTDTTVTDDENITDIDTTVTEELNTFDTAETQPIAEDIPLNETELSEPVAEVSELPELEELPETQDVVSEEISLPVSEPEEPASEETVDSDTEDESTSLSDNELGNILNSANFVTEDAAEITEDNAFDISEEPSIEDSPAVEDLPYDEVTPEETVTEEISPVESVSDESDIDEPTDFVLEEPVADEEIADISSEDPTDFALEEPTAQEVTLDETELSEPAAEVSELSELEELPETEDVVSEEIFLPVSEPEEPASEETVDSDTEDESTSLSDNELGNILNSANFVTEDAAEITEDNAFDISEEPSIEDSPAVEDLPYDEVTPEETVTEEISSGESVSDESDIDEPTDFVLEEPVADEEIADISSEDPTDFALEEPASEETVDSDTEDESTSLSDNELGNILNSANFVTEDAAEITEDNAFDISEEPSIEDSPAVEDLPYDEVTPEETVTEEISSVESVSDESDIDEPTDFVLEEPVADKEIADISSEDPTDFALEEPTAQEVTLDETELSEPAAEVSELPELEELPETEDVVSEEISLPVSEPEELASKETVDSDTEDESTSLSDNELGNILNSANFITEDAAEITEDNAFDISEEPSSSEPVLSENILEEDITNESSTSELDSSETTQLPEEISLPTDDDEVPTVDTVTESQNREIDEISSGTEESDDTESIPTVEELEKTADDIMDSIDEDETLETGISEEPVDSVFNSWGEIADEPEEIATPESTEEASTEPSDIEIPSVSTDTSTEEITDEQFSLLSEPIVDIPEPEPVIDDSDIVTPEELESAPASSSDSIPADMKQEIKSVLSYMDQLLESLPEEKIAEFAKSKQFETYKKLFTELGLSD